MFVPFIFMHFILPPPFCTQPQSMATPAEFYQTAFLAIIDHISIRTAPETTPIATTTPNTPTILSDRNAWCTLSLHTFQRIFALPQVASAFALFREQVLEWELYRTHYSYYLRFVEPTHSLTYPQFLTLFRQLCKLMQLVHINQLTYERSKPVRTLVIAIERIL